MAESIYLSNDSGQKFLYHKIYEANISKELENILPDSGSIDDVVLHWSAGNYSQMYQHYQINITNDAIAVVDKSKILSWKEFSHTWKRNTGRLGISFCAMYDIKKAPVTKLQIDMMIKTLTIICKKFKLNPKTDITSHGYWAKIDNYQGLRWDTDLIVNFDNKKQILTDYIKDRVYEELINKHKIITPVQKEKPVSVPDKYITSSSFTDVKTTDWYSYQSEFVWRSNLMIGDDSTGKRLFYPDRNMTRKEIAVVFSNIIKFLEKKTDKQLPDKKINLFDYQDVVSNTWYYNSVKELSEKGIISGYNINNMVFFKPDQELTRAEFCSLIVSLIKYLGEQKFIITDLNNKLPVKYIEKFIDVTNSHWAWSTTDWCVRKDILVGYKTETGSYFKPDSKVKRCEICVGIYKLIKYIKNSNNLSNITL